MKMSVLLISLLGLLSVHGFTEDIPQPSVTDDRVKSLIYSENQVFKIVCYYGYQIDVQLADNEEMKTIAAGDTLGWQIVNAGQHIFIKPMVNDARTNLSVITNKRTYIFDLSSRSSQGRTDMTYLVRFKYPEKNWVGQLVTGATKNLSEYNFSYTISGAKQLQPSRVFDDGEFTFFQFEKGKDLPAIFVVGPHGEESLVNTRMEGNYVVVERVGDFYTLRTGKETATVINADKLTKEKA